MVGALILVAALHAGVAAAADTGAPRRNLAVDEQRGGHTLARHVGRTDLELRDRLRRESHISAASSYVDRAAAELMVGLALERERGRLESWERRRGSRPNLVLHIDAPRGPPIGRVLARGASTAVTASSASYPEAQ
jgi:hypothetical protein